MEEIVSLPPMEFFNNDYQMVLDFIEALGNPKFKIAGGLDFYCNEKITTLGNLVEVETYLDLGYSDVEDIHNLEKVGSWLSMANSKIKKLPDNLTVGNFLSLRNTNITMMPNNLKVGDYLVLTYTFFSRNFDEIEIRKMIEEQGGFVNGYIYI